MLPADERRDVDTRVRAAVQPPADAIDRVLTRALVQDAVPPRRSYWRTTATIVAVLTAVIGPLVWRWRTVRDAGGAGLTFAIRGEAKSVVVESEDGRRWIVGTGGEPRRPGNYVIVVSR
jgi:hypothetical protein